MPLMTQSTKTIGIRRLARICIHFVVGRFKNTSKDKITIKLLRGTFQVLQSRVGSWPYPQSLDKATKYSLLRTLINYGQKSFTTLGPDV
jgi:hypothetical protein